MANMSCNARPMARVLSGPSSYLAISYCHFMCIPSCFPSPAFFTKWKYIGPVRYVTPQALSTACFIMVHCCLSKCNVTYSKKIIQAHTDVQKVLKENQTMLQLSTQLYPCHMGRIVIFSWWHSMYHLTVNAVSCYSAQYFHWIWMRHCRWWQSQRLEGTKKFVYVQHPLKYMRF